MHQTIDLPPLIPPPLYSPIIQNNKKADLQILGLVFQMAEVPFHFTYLFLPADEQGQTG